MWLTGKANQIYDFTLAAQITIALEIVSRQGLAPLLWLILQGRRDCTKILNLETSFL
jgi:hypothetical protein